tara:strand:+ start:11873 stop:12706 length:834 start_codon:yes stop_codon:yes gene_type:complete
MTKFKHNKKRNTAFLYESLVIELTKAVLNNHTQDQLAVKQLIKESFRSTSLLSQDLQIYNALVETCGVETSTAERILHEAKIQKELINTKDLFNEQNRFIKKANQMLPSTFFSNFVPNYKDLASISQIFNTTVPIKSRILLENEIIHKMTQPKDTSEMLPIDSLSYKIFIEKFNNEYKDKLLKEQKTLLEKYITSFQHNGVELKIYLNDEIGRLKQELKEHTQSLSNPDNTTRHHQLQEVQHILGTFQSQEPTIQMITKVISIQSLVSEIKKDDHSD